jgi:enoyl-CoA hydratase/carnithine racemase
MPTAVADGRSLIAVSFRPGGDAGCRLPASGFLKGGNPMEHIRVERSDGVLVITLARGKANALNAAMLEELHEAVARARADEAVRAVAIVSASTKIFSAGFDLGEVFGYDDDAMAAVFGRLMGLCEELRQLSKPVVAGVSGHAIAGGAVLALACDFRVLSDGDFGFALNEVDLGLVLPRAAMGWLAEPFGPFARQVVLGGMPLSPARAHAIGLASELAPPEAVGERAVAMARALARKPPEAYAAFKSAFSGPRLDEAGRTEAVAEFMRSWSGAESRACRDALARSMKK